jgi:hypothetical protein
VSLDGWRQNFDEPDGRRMVRLGELVESTPDPAALRAALLAALLNRLDATPPSPSRTHEWATSAEGLEDERAWAAEDEGDDAEYGRRFELARAFGAVREATAAVTDHEAVAGAVYELFHSVGSSPDAVFEVLSQAADPWPDLARRARRATG